jgi:hypothetical protein
VSMTKAPDQRFRWPGALLTGRGGGIRTHDLFVPNDGFWFLRLLRVSYSDLRERSVSALAVSVVRRRFSLKAVSKR